MIVKTKMKYISNHKDRVDIQIKEGRNSSDFDKERTSYDEKYSSAAQKTNYTNGSKNNNINISSPEEFSNHDEKCHILQKTVDKNKSNMIRTKKLDYITI